MKATPNSNPNPNPTPTVQSKMAIAIVTASGLRTSAVWSTDKNTKKEHNNIKNGCGRAAYDNLSFHLLIKLRGRPHGRHVPRLERAVQAVLNAKDAPLEGNLDG